MVGSPGSAESPRCGRLDAEVRRRQLWPGRGPAADRSGAIRVRALDARALARREMGAAGGRPAPSGFMFLCTGR